MLQKQEIPLPLPTPGARPGKVAACKVRSQLESHGFRFAATSAMPTLCIHHCTAVHGHSAHTVQGYEDTATQVNNQDLHGFHLMSSQTSRQ